MNGPTQLGLQDFLRAGHVKRWHLINTTKDQTLADHSYNVATIAMSLYKDIVAQSVGNSKDMLLLLLKALYHDAAEVRTGDIPTPGKRLLRHFGGESLFDNIESGIDSVVPFTNTPRMVITFLDDFVVMADHIDAACWIRENGVGVRATEVAEKCWRSMEDLATKLTLDTGADWRAAVNKVLAAQLAPNLRSCLS